MNFKKDLVDIARTILDHWEVPLDSMKKDWNVVAAWVNIKSKLIVPKPRDISVSAEFSSKELDDNTQKALEEIKRKLSKGHNVNPHLSKSIFDPDVTDYLLCDWSMYHLHLNVCLERSNSFFIKRSDELLFITVDNSTSYLIDIRPHNENYIFAQKDLLVILDKNWPHLLEPYRSPAKSIEYSFNNPEEIHKLRKAGVITIQEANGKFYLPSGGGINTARTSAKVVEETDMLFKKAKQAQEWIVENEAQLRSNRIKQGLKISEPLNFSLVLTPNGFAIIETQLGVEIPLTFWR